MVESKALRTEPEFVPVQTIEDGAGKLIVTGTIEGHRDEEIFLQYVWPDQPTPLTIMMRGDEALIVAQGLIAAVLANGIEQPGEDAVKPTS